MTNDNASVAVAITVADENSNPRQHQVVPQNESATTTSATTMTTRPLPHFYPHDCCGRPVFRGNSKALAWSLYEIGNYISSIGITVFLGTALLKLAREAAGCSNDTIPGTNRLPTCETRVYGVIKPSSILTAYAIVVSVAAAVFMPLMGAMMDYTPHRRLVGRISAIVSCILFVPRIFINEKTWFAIAILQLFFGAFIGWNQNVVAYAYLPELTNDKDELNGYVRTFAVLSFSSMFIYLGITVALASALGISNDDVATAQLGMGIAFVVTTVAFAWAWGCLFEKRPAARPLSSSSSVSLCKAGFSQLYRTLVDICQTYAALKWFYLSISMSDAGVLSLASIVVTFFTDTLNMSASENGTAVLILLVASVPGAFLSGWWNTKINPVRSSMVALIMVMIVTIVAAFVLEHPGQQVASYLLCAGWGLAIGWKWTCDRVVAATILPNKRNTNEQEQHEQQQQQQQQQQDAELMALYLSAGLIICWLPPLVYTALNEAGVSQRVGLGALSLFFALSLICLIMLGSYDDAIRVVSVRDRASVQHNAEEEEGAGLDSDKT